MKRAISMPFELSYAMPALSGDQDGSAKLLVAGGRLARESGWAGGVSVGVAVDGEERDSVSVP